MRLLILGGTTEASRLAAALAGRAGLRPTLSLAGRTAVPAASPLPRRIGGFGGADGLARYLATEAVEAVVDATHPFAARISAHAVTACARTGVPLLAYSRAAWTAQPGDDWRVVPDIAAAVAALAARPAEAVLLTTGRLDLGAFRAAPQHRYLVRSIDPPAAETLPPDATLLLDRGPFTVAGEVALLARHGIATLVTKNSGGSASAPKLAAARRLGVPVLMVARPAPPARAETDDLEAVLDWIARHAPAR